MRPERLKMMFEDAIKQVEGWILDAWNNRPDEAKVEIYVWPDDKTYGLRVAEISLSGVSNQGFAFGASFMQSDPECAKAIFLTERAILDIACFMDDDPDLAFAKEQIIKEVHGS